MSTWLCKVLSRLTMAFVLLMVIKLRAFLFSYVSIPRNQCTFLSGAFLDLGELIPGSICNVNLVIRNNSSQEIQLDVVARGFPSQDIHIVTLPNSFAPGLTRNVNVSFTVHKQIFDVLAFIGTFFFLPMCVTSLFLTIHNTDIVVVPVRTESSVTLSCPLYYRVCESTSSRRLTSFPVCSVSLSLPISYSYVSFLTYD